METPTKKKISERSRSELIETAAKVIKASWYDQEDAEERASDAAHLIARRLDWSGYTTEDELKIEKEIIEYF